MPGQAVRKSRFVRSSTRSRSSSVIRNVLLVDDSIVRGTTCSEIIRMAREAGAKSVNFASASPAVRYPNVYGIDMPAARELIAHGRTTEQVQEIIGADWLIYQDLDDLRAAATEGNPDLTTYEDSVFSGRYITGDVSETYLDELEAARKDSSKAAVGHEGALEDED